MEENHAQPTYMLTSSQQPQQVITHDGLQQTQYPQQPVYTLQGSIQQPQPVVVISGLQQTQYQQQQELQQPCSTQQMVYYPPGPMPQQHNEGTVVITSPTEGTHLINEEELVDCCGSKKRALYVYLSKACALLALAFSIMLSLCLVFEFTSLNSIYYVYVIVSLFVASLIIFLLLFFFRNRFPFNIIFLFLFAVVFGVALGSVSCTVDPSFSYSPFPGIFFALELSVIYFLTTKIISIVSVFCLAGANAGFFFGFFFFVVKFQPYFFFSVALSLALNLSMAEFINLLYKQEYLKNLPQEQRENIA